MEYVTNVDSKVDPLGAAETMLLLCDRLGIDDEVKSLCAKSVAAKAERGAQKPIVPAQLLRLRYTLDDSMVALSTIISGVRKWLPAETPIANMDKVRGYRDSLDLPECVTVETTSTLGEASSTARAMRIADCLKAGLAQSAFVQAMDWEGLGEDIHLIFGIDGANMTVARCGLSMCCRPRFPLSTCRAANRACVSAPPSSINSRPSARTPVALAGDLTLAARLCVYRSLELAFVGCLNQRLIRHAPAGAFITYIGEHAEKRKELQAAIREQMVDMPAHVDVPCLGGQCKFPGCSGEGGEPHRSRVQCWHVCDLSATLKSMGCQQNCCFRCGENLTKKNTTEVARKQKKRKVSEEEAGAGEAGEVWNPEEHPVTELKMQAYVDGTKAYEAAEAAWAERVGPTDDTFDQEAAEYKTWQKDYPHMNGPCVLHENFDELEQIINDPLHRVMNLVNWMMMRTCKRIAVKRERDGFSGVADLCKGAQDAGLPWFKSKVWKRYMDALKGAATVDLAGTQEDAAHAASAGDKRLVEIYVSESKMTVKMMELELFALGVPKEEIRALANKPSKAAKLQTMLMSGLRDGSVKRSSLTFKDRRSPADQKEFEENVSKYGAKLHRKVLSDSQTIEIIDGQIQFMGSECVKLLKGGALTILEAQNGVLNALKVKEKEEQGGVTKKLGEVEVEKTRLTKLLKAQRKKKGGSASSEAALLTQKIAGCDGDRDRLIAKSKHLAKQLKDWKQHQDEAPLYDPDVETAIADWKLFADWLVPICDGEMPSGGAHQEKVNTWYTHHVAHYGTTPSHYVHYCVSHMAHDLDWLRAKYPGLSLASLSAQRSEHCNKLVKLKMAHLWAFTQGTGKRKDGSDGRTSFELIMRDAARRILYFLDTIPTECTDVCGACGEVGHRKTNSRKCPMFAVSALEEGL